MDDLTNPDLTGPFCGTNLPPFEFYGNIFGLFRITHASQSPYIPSKA